ncbi:MAG: site-specific DNA-methyltransferase, partial [Candidatus Aenigmatarchaeota archaeon]
IDFNHPLTLLDLQILQDELKNRPNEERDITIVCLGKESAVDAWIDEWNKKHPVNKIDVIELKTDKKYGGFLIHRPAEAKVKIERKGNKGIIKIQDFISPTIIQRLNIDTNIWKVKISDFKFIIDCVLIDSNYDGKTFCIVHSDVPEKKSDLIKGNYEIDIPKERVKIAVKIIDMLGEEVLIVKEI